MAVILTSFRTWRRSGEPGGYENAYSVARWQPTGYCLKNLPALAAVDKRGQKMLLRHYTDPLNGYRNDLREAYAARWRAIKQWLNNLDNKQDIYLCCWCPYSTQTSSQITVHGTFACHTGLIGQMIRRHRPDIDLIMDKDREQWLTPSWRPEVPQAR